MNRFQSSKASQSVSYRKNFNPSRDAEDHTSAYAQKLSGYFVEEQFMDRYSLDRRQEPK